LTDVVLPARRTQAAIIASGPVRERFGWAELKLQSLAKEDGGKGDHVVAPLANEVEIGAVLRSIDWQPPDNPQWQRVSRAYVAVFSLMLVPLVLVAAANLFFQPVFGLAGLAVLALGLATRFMAWRRYAYALDGDRLIVRSGWWRRRIKILPLGSVQSVDYRQSLVARRFGVADILIGVAGGGTTSHTIQALPAETARGIARHLLSRFA
jgi:putative membrane protein